MKKSGIVKYRSFFSLRILSLIESYLKIQYLSPHRNLSFVVFQSFFAQPLKVNDRKTTVIKAHFKLCIDRIVNVGWGQICF